MKESIAIDGPSGAGKSTIARRVAKELGFLYIDTGSMYRAMAYYFVQQGVPAEDTEKIRAQCRQIEIAITYEAGIQQVWLNSENVTAFLREEAIGRMASVVAANADVRRKLVEIQQHLASVENVVMDGRDIGTCVIPNASLKIYLTASSKTRAQRRFQELTEKDVPCNIEEIEADIIARDKRDMSREISPLRRADDAVLVDSSDMSIDEVVAHVIRLFQEVTA